MAILAIEGHPKRGNEVIGILEMMGGNNANNCCGKYCDRAYYINENGYIDQDYISHIERNTKFIIFSLEEFLEKFPYKVGDKVLYKIYGIHSKIKTMLWNVEKEQVFYRLESNKLFVATANELKPLKEEIMEEINIAELLKDCPSGMELYSPLCGDCKLFNVHDYENNIIVELDGGTTIAFKPDGKYYNYPNAECLLFPKGKTTWEGFQRPFLNGDVVATDSGSWIGITTGGIYNESIPTYCIIDPNDSLRLYFDKPKSWSFSRLATEEEKAKLFQAIKDNGYKWNEETKTLEKLPKFKVGDRVMKKDGISVPILITGVGDTYYWSTTENSTGVLPIAEQDEYELVLDKFDINTLKSFDKVLTRANDDDSWVCNLYSHRIKDYYVILNAELAPQCIPYEQNKHLLNTSNNCDEYFKTWE